MTRSMIWLASYPKSGSTWFRAVLTAMRTGAVDLDRLHGAPVASSRVVFDDVLGVLSSDLTATEVDELRPYVDDVVADTAIETPLVRKIHDALLPSTTGDLVVSTASTAGAIYVVRDPRDVAVSYAHHHDRSIDWAVNRLCDPDSAISSEDGTLHQQVRQRLGTWAEHVRSWVDGAPFPVHLVRYEDCRRDPVTTFRRALAFAGLDAAHAEVAAAVDLAAFDRLRTAESERGFVERHGTSPFFRRGVAGGWRGDLTLAQIARLEEANGDVMRRFEYELAAR